MFVNNCLIFIHDYAKQTIYHICSWMLWKYTGPSWPRAELTQGPTWLRAESTHHPSTKPISLVNLIGAWYQTFGPVYFDTMYSACFSPFVYSHWIRTCVFVGQICSGNGYHRYIRHTYSLAVWASSRVGTSGTTAKSRQRIFVPSSHPGPFALVASSHKSQTKVGTLACFDFL